MPWWCIDPQCCCRDHSLAWHLAFFLLMFLAPFCCHIKQTSGLHFQGLFHLIAHFIQHQKINLHTWKAHSPCLAIRCLYSVSWDSCPCLWESLCKNVVPLCCRSSTSLQKYLLAKNVLPQLYCKWAQVAGCDILSLRPILQERRCYNIKNFQKHHMKSLLKGTRTRLNNTGPQH